MITCHTGLRWNCRLEEAAGSNQIVPVLLLRVPRSLEAPPRVSVTSTSWLGIVVSGERWKVDIRAGLH